MKFPTAFTGEQFYLVLSRDPARGCGCKPGYWTKEQRPGVHKHVPVAVSRSFLEKHFPDVLDGTADGDFAYGVVPVPPGLKVAAWPTPAPKRRRRWLPRLRSA